MRILNRTDLNCVGLTIVWLPCGGRFSGPLCQKQHKLPEQSCLISSNQWQQGRHNRPNLFSEGGSKRNESLCWRLKRELPVENALSSINSHKRRMSNVRGHLQGTFLPRGYIYMLQPKYCRMRYLLAVPFSCLEFHVPDFSRKLQLFDCLRCWQGWAFFES